MMTVMNYRKAIAEGIGRALRSDQRVVFLGEDVGAAGGAFKSTVGLYEEFGPDRVWDTPISEQAIVGAAMGAAMTGLRPIAEIMFTDFLGVCWDMVANQVAKARYMSGGQLEVPLVIRAHGGAGLGFGAQHSQTWENLLMSIPGIKVAAPSTPRDVIGLLAAAVADPDPVILLEHKALFDAKEDVPDEPFLEPLGSASIRRTGDDLTLVALSAMVPVAVQAAATLEAEHGISAEVIDLRSVTPTDTATLLQSVERTSRLMTVEENPRPCGWGAEIASIVAEEGFTFLDAPIQRVTSANVPVPFAANLEHATIPNADTVVKAVLSYS
ncbi:MAG: alpha-ketoacid dehydrogenase subunit beta [Propionibacteriales bacterium]|nr:alpha-ketoacid dehydrogenase subunit beta [Propionibacteriales bacterium]